MVGGRAVNANDPTGEAGMLVTFPGYSVDTGMGFSVPLVHAGVVAIDNKTGQTQYFDFGRYGGKYGDVRGPKDVGTVSFDQKGMITNDSMQQLNKTLASTAGKGITPTTIYNSQYNAESIAGFALDRQANVADHPYTINPLSDKPFNVCVTFAWDAFQAGNLPQNSIPAATSSFNPTSDAANGGFLLYPNKPNTNTMKSVYSK